MGIEWNKRLFAALWFSSISLIFMLWWVFSSGPPLSGEELQEQYRFIIEIVICTFPCGWLLGHKIISYKNRNVIKLRSAAFIGMAIVFLSSVNFSVYEASRIHDLSQTRNFIYAAFGYLLFETVIVGILIYPLGIMGSCLFWYAGKRVNSKNAT